jgi:hypothetical protein
VNRPLIFSLPPPLLPRLLSSCFAMVNRAFLLEGLNPWRMMADRAVST